MRISLHRALLSLACALTLSLNAQDISQATVKANGTTSSRSEADRWSDLANVKDFGASPGQAPSLNADAINQAFASFSTVYVPSGRYACSKDIIIPDGCTLNGEGIIDLSNARIILSSNSQIKNITITGTNQTNPHELIYSSQSNNITIKNIKILDSLYNGIVLSHVNDAEIRDCVVNNCGNASLSDKLNTGCGIYLGACSLVRINGNRISNIYGDGGIKFIDTNKISLINNFIYKTMYRGIIGYGNGTIGEIFIATNRLEQIGELNTTDSAVGCNGIAIFSELMDIYSCVIQNNYLNAIAENGIEVSSGGDISGNTVINTGYKPTLISPSYEGIFVGQKSRIINNNIYLTRGPSIRVFIDNKQTQFGTDLPPTTGSIEIRNNNCKIPGNNFCIDVKVDGSGKTIERLSIVGNELYTGTIQAIATNGAKFDSNSVKINNNWTYTNLLPNIDSSITTIKDNSFNK